LCQITTGLSQDKDKVARS